MDFDTLPTEIITQIYLSMPDIKSALSLSATSHRFHNVYRRQRLPILQEAVDSEYGPISDIIQLVTQNASQSPQIRRNVAVSDALIRQIIDVGRTAEQWADIYPYKKWKTTYADRRILTAGERFLVRRAIYRLWLFDAAFHTRAHVRTMRRVPGVMAERVALLHNYPTTELAEMMDVHAVIRDVVANNICPSNGKIRQKFRKRYPDSNHQLLFNIHLNYPPASRMLRHEEEFHSHSIPSFNKQSARLQPSRFHEPGAEGWGDEVSHYYVVEDMMKLNPEQILWLKERCVLKSEVEAYVRERADDPANGHGGSWIGGGGGEWFVNNGETFSETAAFVVRQRGGDMEDLKQMIDEDDAGIVIVE